MKIFITLLIALLTFACGFQPIYKVSDTDENIMSFELAFNNSSDVSRYIKDEIEGVLISDGQKNHEIIMSIDEDRVPLIINTNGTVAKYRITVIIDFILKDLNTNEMIINDSARGQAQYDVVTSEIENEDRRLQMTRSATRDAVQIMTSKILSSIRTIDDN